MVDEEERDGVVLFVYFIYCIVVTRQNIIGTRPPGRSFARGEKGFRRSKLPAGKARNHRDRDVIRFNVSNTEIVVNIIHVYIFASRSSFAAMKRMRRTAFGSPFSHRLVLRLSHSLGSIMLYTALASAVTRLYGTFRKFHVVFLTDSAAAVRLAVTTKRASRVSHICRDFLALLCAAAAFLSYERISLRPSARKSIQ